MMNFQVAVADSFSGKVSWELTLKNQKIKSGITSLPGEEIIIPEAVWWSPSNPALYSLKLGLVEGNKVIDEYNLDIGMRTISVDKENILLNGEPIELRGACKHEDSPVMGKGLNMPYLIKDFSLLRWLGANTIRCTHYPYAEEFFQQADREGFLTFGEVPAFALLGNKLNPELMEFHKAMIRGLIERDQNHSSIIGWYVANEPYFTDGSDIDSDPPQHFVDYFKEICNYTRSLDSRPITIAGSTRRDETFLWMCDIVSVNRYQGWYFHCGRIEQGIASLSEELDRLHQQLKKPIIVSEFGGDGFVGEHSEPPEMFTEEYQAKLLQETIKMLDGKSYVAGKLIWCFADFKVSQVANRVRENHKGIFTRDRCPKLAARAVRALWKKLPLFE